MSRALAHLTLHVRLLGTIVLGTFPTTNAGAQTQTPSLRGHVVDAQGAGVNGALITLASPASASNRSASRAKTVHSQSDGTFTFTIQEGVAPGSYVLQVDAPGFQRWTDTIALPADSAAAFEVVLEIAGVSEGVIVSGNTPLGLTTPAPTASRLGLTPLETPASVAIVPGNLIRDLGTPTLVVAKALAPGITSSAPMGSGGNVLNARGFTGQNSVKQLFNGMEIYNAGGVVSFPFDPWNVDHIGVLYGPASVLYGSGAIGGAVNVVPKRPDPTQRQHEIALSGGSFNSYHAAVGTTGPIGERLSYRVDASRYSSDHWVDRGQSNSLALSGSLRFDARKNLRFTLSNDFGDQNPSTYLGTPVLDNKPVDGLRKKNYNVDDAKLHFRDNWTNVETVWTPSTSVSIHNNTYYLYHDRVYRDVPTFAYVPATDSVRRTQFRDINDTYETQYGNTGYVKYAGRLFGRRNDVLVGLDLNRNYYHRNDNVRGGSSIVNARDFSPGHYLDFYAMESKPFYRIHVNQFALFTEDHLHLTDRLSLVFGARRDSYHVNRYDNLVMQTTTSNHDATGWNSGAVYDLAPGLSLYGQYAAASDPVNSLASIAANQQGFHLSPGRQAEVGLKQSTLNTHLEWTFAAYRLVKKELLTPSLQDPTLTEQVGQQSSRGVEASVSLTAGSLRVSVNGTTLDAKFDDFKATVGNAVVQLAGNVPVNVPERSANLLLFWDATPAWQVRSVLRYVGTRYADNTNSAASRIPSYSVLDFGVRWRTSARLSLDLRIDNTLDEVYADSGSATAWLLGQPRSVTLSANLRF